MYPVALNLTRIPVLLCGRGELLARRLRMLKEAGAAQIQTAEMPLQEQIARAAIIMVAGLSREESETVAKAARAAGRLVNVEDMNDLCDFYFTANVRRGDLVIAVSTSGASPTLARKLRDKIAEIFDVQWEERTADIAARRKEWKQQGKTVSEVLTASEEYIAKKGWLSSSVIPAKAGVSIATIEDADREIPACAGMTRP